MIYYCLFQDTHLYNFDEVALNEQLHNFAEHCSEYLKGQNTIKSQIGLNSKQADSTGTMVYFVNTNSYQGLAFRFNNFNLRQLYYFVF